MSFTRRGFVGGLGGAAAMGISNTSLGQTACEPQEPAADTSVRLSGDGIGLTPQAFASLLERLCHGADIAQDNYLLGGEIEQFEQYCAKTLGKEMAVFMPSGTLANQIALREHAGVRRRVIVPDLSHVYNDTGDACQTLANLNLIPIASDSATFSLEDVEEVIERTAGGRVSTNVGAILIESPVRRLLGETFEWNEAKRIAAYAREQGIGTHLDGARLFIAAAYNGRTPAEIAAPFDTVYVSLWKYFNSGIGAILAGPRSMLNDLFHVRRMFGGNLNAGWSAAVIARHYMNGYVERLKSAVQISEEFYASIAEHPKVSVTRVSRGTNVARMKLSNTDIPLTIRRLREQDILLRSADDEGVVTLGVNETWNRVTSAELTSAFERALA